MLYKAVIVNERKLARDGVTGFLYEIANGTVTSLKNDHLLHCGGALIGVVLGENYSLLPYKYGRRK